MKTSDAACPDWVCHKDGGSSDPWSDVLIAARAEVEVVGVVTDADANYSFDDYALVVLDGMYFLLRTEGCSCPRPEEEWTIVIGPATLSEIRAHLVDAAGESGYSVTKKQHEEFMALVDQASPTEGQCMRHDDCREIPHIGRACLAERMAQRNTRLKAELSKRD